MSDKYKSVKLGIVSILSLFLLYFGMNYLKGVNVMNNENIFYAYYENIEGLTEGNSITIKGFKVGTVIDIDFDSDRDNALKVILNVESDINIPTNTIAKIVSLDLMGTKGISLILGNNKEFANSGFELSSSIESSLQDEVNSQILPLKNKTEQLIGSIDSVMTVITSVLNKDARESLTKSLSSLDKTFSTLSETMTIVDQMVKENQINISTSLSSFASVTENIKSSNEDISNIINNFSSISDSLITYDIVSTLSNIDQIVGKINKSEGSLGLLINDKELYDNFKSASKELEDLLEDMKLNPKRYVNFSILGSSKKPYVQKDE